LYSKGIKVGRLALKLKGGLGIKIFVSWGLPWGIVHWQDLQAEDYGKSCSPLLWFLFSLESKLFINSAIYDFKDIKEILLQASRPFQ
jgi:hypothetical protein